MPFFNFGRHKGTAGEQYRQGGMMVPRWSAPPDRNTAEWIDTFGKNPRLAVVAVSYTHLTLPTKRIV